MHVVANAMVRMIRITMKVIINITPMITNLYHRFSGLAISYAIAIPLGSAMARYKNTWIDSFSTGALTFLLALPA